LLSLFQSFSQVFDQGINTGIQATINQVLTAVRTPYNSAALLYIIFLGYQATYGRIDVYDLTMKAIHLSVVGLLLQPGNFEQWISTPLLHNIPDLLSSAISGGTATANQTGNQFDVLLQRIVHEGATQMAQTSFWDVPTRIEIFAVNVMSIVPLAISWLVYKIQQFLLNLVVAVIPITLVLSLFPVTREMLTRNLGKAAGIIISILLVTITMNWVIDSNTAFMNFAINANPGGTVSGEIAAVPVRLWGQVAVMGFMFMTCLTLIVVPTIGAFIGGGIAVSLTPSFLAIARLIVTKGRGF
jgi:type IV secretion system protein VirB6